MTRKLYCYSHQEFDDLMKQLGWKHRPEDGYSTISISSKNEDNSGHWFILPLLNNMNLDFDDCSPEQWWDRDYYDDALDAAKNYNEDIENSFFDFKYEGIDLHIINYTEAHKLVQFIDDRIKEGDHIFIHCNAGASRSQGVVRYILDTYPDIDWETREDNPCLTPNYHVVRMLKRAYRELFY